MEQKALQQQPIPSRFFTGLALLSVEVIPLFSGLWLLWQTLWSPDLDNSARAYEIAYLVRMVESANSKHDAQAALEELLRTGHYPDRENADRVNRAAATLLTTDRAFRLDPAGGIAALLAEQDDDLRLWRLKRILLLVIPALLVGCGIGAIGLRTLRRLRLSGTVFEGRVNEVTAGSRRGGHPGPASDDRETQACLQCGRTMSTKESTCAACGWSYQAGEATTPAP